MKRILLILFYSLTIATFGCKKKSNDNTVAVPKLKPPFIYGSLNVGTFIATDYYTGAITSYATADAYFINDSVNNQNTDAGRVMLNADTMHEDGGKYFVVFFNSFSNNLTWGIEGSSSVPAFSYTLADNFPQYSGTIPDTFFMLNGFILDVSASFSQNADSIYVHISNHSNTVGYFRAFKAQAQIMITPQELNRGENIPVTFDRGRGSVTVTSVKYDYVTINNRLYQFKRQSSIMKSIYIL